MKLTSFQLSLFYVVYILLHCLAKVSNFWVLWFPASTHVGGALVPHLLLSPAIHRRQSAKRAAQSSTLRQFISYLTMVTRSPCLSLLMFLSP